MEYISSHCWYSLNETVDSLPTQAKKIMCFPCESFEEKLLFESKLVPESEEYLLLKDILYQRLTFDRRRVEKKLHAVVAGSYAAFLGRAVKQHGDVDVFIVAHDVDLVRDLLRLVRPSCMELDLYREVNEQIASYGDVIAVKDFGKVQLILKHHFHECLCDFHLNASFFGDFHHCTRWRLDVFDKFFLVRYMSLQAGRDRDIMCLETSITPRMRPARGHSRKRKNPSKPLYPNKHVDNVVNFGPPRLSQQALHAILKY